MIIIEKPGNKLIWLIILRQPRWSVWFITLSTRISRKTHRPWKTWKHYEKLTSSKNSNVIKAKRVWTIFRKEKEKGKIFIQWAALITNWRIKRGKITCECFTFERELYSRMVLQWWKNGWTSFPSRSQGPFHNRNHYQMFFIKCLKISKIFLKLGWNSKKKILVRELNEPLKCQICSGYLINPTVVNECQHTFCKTVSEKPCPICLITDESSAKLF